MSVALPLPRSIAARSLYGLAGIAAAVAASVLVSPWLLALLLAPDLALIGAFDPSVKGRIKRSAVARYNAVHVLPVPIALAAAGLALGLPLAAGIGLIWISHITLDRSLGFGLRDRSGDQRG